VRHNNYWSAKLMSSLIENLLYQSEGTALDFKKEQYPFEKATDEQKSELLGVQPTYV
jgi:hypothetical protein